MGTAPFKVLNSQSQPPVNRFGQQFMEIDIERKLELEERKTHLLDQGQPAPSVCSNRNNQEDKRGGISGV